MAAPIFQEPKNREAGVARLLEVLIRVDPAEWDAVKECAKADGVSAAEFVRRLLKRSLAHRVQRRDRPSSAEHR